MYFSKQHLLDPDLMKELDREYTFNDFFKECSLDDLQNKIYESQRDLNQTMQRIDTIRKRKEKLGIGYYFIKLGFRMKRALKQI